MKTYMPKAADMKTKTVLIDAGGQVLGRLATRVARILIGKNEPTYAPHIIQGDTVIVINAKDIRVTGRKAQQKEYDRYSGYPGGRHVMSYAKVKEERPTYIIEQAVRGMLPNNRLRQKRMKRLRIFADADHPHQAQQPQWAGPI
jgi:large subunit ribosomal protein L13